MENQKADLMFVTVSVFCNGLINAKTVVGLDKIDKTEVWVCGVAFELQRCYSHVKISTQHSQLHLYSDSEDNQTAGWTQDQIAYSDKLSWSAELVN